MEQCAKKYQRRQQGLPDEKDSEGGAAAGRFAWFLQGRRCRRTLLLYGDLKGTLVSASRHEMAPSSVPLRRDGLRICRERQKGHERRIHRPELQFQGVLAWQNAWTSPKSNRSATFGPRSIHG